MSRFHLWVAGATVSTLGDSVSYFAIAWAATGFGAEAAGWVLTAEGLPLVLLILIGGVVGDRYGIRRTMIACDLAMVVVMGLFALGSEIAVPLWGLFAVAVLSATAAALRRPAAGAFPSLFGTGPELQRRMALVTGGAQIARVAGPGLGGALLGLGGLSLATGLDATSFLVVALALVLVRPPQDIDRQDLDRQDVDPRDRNRPADQQRTAADGVERRPESTWRSIGAGLLIARRTPGVPSMILAVFCLSGAVLPLVSLALPLLGRARGWSATGTGAVGAAWTVGGLLVTLAVARRGAPRPGLAVAGPMLALAGVALVGVTPSPAAGLVGIGLVGVGTSLLTTHLFPLFAEVAPSDVSARFWSLLHLAQTLPTAVLMPVLGSLAAAAGPESALAVVAVLLLLTAAAAVGVVRRAPALVVTPEGVDDH